jgi:hypothetical protein
MKNYIIIFLLLISNISFSQKIFYFGYGIDKTEKTFLDITLQNKYKSGVILSFSFIPYLKTNTDISRDSRGASLNVEGGYEFGSGEFLAVQFTGGVGYTLISDQYNYYNANTNLRVRFFKYFFVNGGMVYPFDSRTHDINYDDSYFIYQLSGGINYNF